MHSRHIEARAGGNGSSGAARGGRRPQNVTSDETPAAEACDGGVSDPWTTAAVSGDGASGATPGDRTSDEDIVRHPFLILGSLESLGLEVEHREVAASERHQLVVCAKLH